MIEQVKYRFGEDIQLVAEVPTAVFDEALKETKLPDVIENKHNLVNVDAQEGGVTLTFNKQPFKEHRWPMDQAEAAASQWLYAINAVQAYTPKELIDPRLEVFMSQDSPGDLSGQQRLGFHGILAWPLRSFEAAESVATTVMRDAAVTFGYLDKKIADSVHASVHPEYGVELQALDIACSCVSTDGMYYNPVDTQVELYGHNLYNRQLMLTCFIGLVALARYE